MIRLLLALALSIPHARANERARQPPPKLSPSSAGALSNTASAAAKPAGAGAAARAGQAPPAALLPASTVARPAAAQPAAAPSQAVRPELGAAPLVFRAQSEAAKLGSLAYEDAPVAAAAAPAFGGLRSDTYAFAPALSAERLRAVNAEIDAHRGRSASGFNHWELYNRPRGWTNTAWQPKDGGEMAPIIRAVESMLRDAVPHEPVLLRDAHVRFESGRADLDNVHVDGGAYFTVTVTLRGPGTLIYRIGRDGRIMELEAPLGAPAAISNFGRQLATGLLGTPHSAPYPQKYRAGEERRMLIMRFERRGQDADIARESKRLDEANRHVIERIQRWRDAKLGRAPPRQTSFLDRLFGRE